MKKILSFTLVAAMLFSIPFINGCKKGEDDPFLSLRSRDSRITGTWKLDSYESVDKGTTVTKTTNSVNGENSESTTTHSTKVTFSGGIKSEITRSVTDAETTTIDFNVLDNNFDNTKTEILSENKTTILQIYSVEITIDDDYTYTVNYNETNRSKTTFTSNTYEGDTQSHTEDTIYSPQNSNVWAQEGNWFWLDANEEKVIISAGPLSGKILRLSNKELIIEDIDIERDVNTVYNVFELNTYNDINDPSKMVEGTQTIVTTTNSEYSTSSTWEKE